MRNAAVQHFEFTSSSRGFRVYKNTENWKRMKGQELKLHSEFDNNFARFAVAGKILLPSKIAPSIVGHVQRELSRYICYALRYGNIATAEGKDELPKRLALVQRGLEILIEMSILWNDTVKIKKLKEKLETVQIGDYTDQSNKVLKEMGVDVDEEDKES